MLNKIVVLGSSSKCCAYELHFINTVLQIDAGKVSHPEIIDGLLISHRDGHIDHYREAYKLKHKPLKYQSQHVSLYKNIPNLIIHEFEVPHIVSNVGFTIEYQNENILYVTDCGDWKKLKIPQTKPFTLCMVECNGDYELVKSYRKPDSHTLYAMSELGHMSNGDTFEFIKHYCNDQTKILLLHKSSTNTDISTYDVFNHLPNPVKIATANMIIYISVGKDL